MYNIYSAYVQLILDLQKEPRFTTYNDISITEDTDKSYSSFGVVCFYERSNTLYSCYVRLLTEVSSTCEHNVVVVEREVGTNIERTLITGMTDDLDEIFTYLYNIDDRVGLLMVNEYDDPITYKYPDLVTFIDDDNAVYDKLLENCNYAIVRD